jgi:hypothetical protein
LKTIRNWQNCMPEIAPLSCRECCKVLPSIFNGLQGLAAAARDTRATHDRPVSGISCGLLRRADRCCQFFPAGVKPKLNRVVILVHAVSAVELASARSGSAVSAFFWMRRVDLCVFCAPARHPYQKDDRPPC